MGSKCAEELFARHGYEPGVLGSGGFGDVFLVRRNNEDVALKLVSLKKVRDIANKGGFTAEQTAHFICMVRDEAAIHRSMNHPNIVKLFHSIEDDFDGGTLLHEMEYCRFGTLGSFIAQRAVHVTPERIPESLIRRWFRQLASAIEHIHNQGILHRDIKAENIFLTDHGRSVKLGDFGIARSLDQQTGMSYVPNMVTVSHASPEMLLGSRRTTKSDTWAVGVLLYQVTTLRLPFTGQTVFMTQKRIASGEREEIPEHMGYSEELTRVINWLLKLDPESRPTMSELLKDSFLQAADTTVAIGSSDDRSLSSKADSGLGLSSFVTSKKIADLEAENAELKRNLTVMLESSLEMLTTGQESLHTWTLQAVKGFHLVDRTLEIIQRRVQKQQRDAVLYAAWGMLWNATDESPENCRRLLDAHGADIYVECFRAFAPTSAQWAYLMTGSFGNVAEIAELRPRLRKSRDFLVVVSAFIEPVAQTDDGFLDYVSPFMSIDDYGLYMSLAAVKLFAYLLSDGTAEFALESSGLDASQVSERIVHVILHRWKLHEPLTISYQSLVPLLQLTAVYWASPVAPLYATWRLANLVLNEPEEYVPMLVRDGGQSILQGLLAATNHVADMESTWRMSGALFPSWRSAWLKSREFASLALDACKRRSNKK